MGFVRLPASANACRALQIVWRRSIFKKKKQKTNPSSVEAPWMMPPDTVTNTQMHVIRAGRHI